MDFLCRAPAHSPCTCHKDAQSRLIPNKTKPCERHFVFESLAEKTHSKRIRTLNIEYFNELRVFHGSGVSLALGGCRFFGLYCPELTNLNWFDRGLLDPKFLLPRPFFSPKLRSLSFRGHSGHDQLVNIGDPTSFLRRSRHNQLMKISNLTSFTFAGLDQEISTNSFWTIILKNKSLETLSLDRIKFKGNLDQQPVTLGEIRSFSLHQTSSESVTTLSTLIHIPAFQHISSLYISPKEDGKVSCWPLLRATGQDITFTVDGDPDDVVAAWEGLVGYLRPTIQCNCYESPGHFCNNGLQVGTSEIILTLFTDAHTLNISCAHSCLSFSCLYPDFWDNLKKLGPELTTIQVEIPKQSQWKASECGCDPKSERLIVAIEDLVRYRFEHGQPFSSVKSMVSESDKVNTEQELIWREFLDRLDQYVQLK